MSSRKKIRFVPWTVIIIMALTSCALENPNNILQKEKKLKTETKWRLDFSNETKLSVISQKEYNTEGKLVKFCEFNENGSITIKSSYSYNDNSCKEVTDYFNISGTVDSSVNFIYVHDNSGKIIKKTGFDLNGNPLFTQDFYYDTRGNVLKKVEYSSNGSVRSETSYAYNYNTDGNIISRVINPGTNGSYTARDSIIYRMDNYNVERVTYNSTGNVDIIYSYTYNSDGRIIKEMQTSKDGSLLKKFLYEYLYY